MYICKGSGLMQYETFDEILNAEITQATEHKESYYFMIKYDDPYANTVWVVDKKTEKVSSISLIDYFLLEHENGADFSPIDWKTLKRAV